MSRLRLRPWYFGKDEEVELYWHGVPFLNPDGLWMLKCLFRKSSGSLKEHTFPFGTLPHLRIGQTYVNGDHTEKPGTGSLYEVRISSSITFDICKAFDFPKSLYAFFKPPAPFYGNLPICRFGIDGVFYYIPCMEIVRSILVPYKEFANRILRPDGLDFFIDRAASYRNILEIDFTDEYPLQLTKGEAFLYFIWLKFDKAAARSWESVYKNTILEASANTGGEAAEELRKGIPVKVLPPVNGLSKWTFRGLEYKRNILILELIHRSDLEIPFELIRFYHPKKERLETDNLPRYREDPTIKTLDDNIELDTTGQGAEKRPAKNLVDEPPIMFTFKRIPKIIKKSSKIRRIHTGSIITYSTKQDGNKSDIATTQDWVQGGNIPQIEFSILKMIDANLSKGLEDFLKMIEYIKKNAKNLALSLVIVPLPQFRGFSRYEDGSIRTCAIVRIVRQGSFPCYIIEVGRADEWSISTLIIKPTTSKNADAQAFEDFVQKLLWELVKNCGHWNRELHFTGYFFDFAKHISRQPIIKWTERILEKICLI